MFKSAHIRCVRVLLDGEIYWWYVLVEVSIFLKSFDTSVVDSITKTAEMI